MSRGSSLVSWNVIKHHIDVGDLEQRLGLTVISASGSEDTCRCPLPSHPGVDANPSFSINREKMVFNCFTCGEGGSIPTLVMTMLDMEYDTALEWMLGSENEGIDLDEGFEAHILEILQQDRYDVVAFPVFDPAVIDPWRNQPTDYFGPHWVNPSNRGVERGRGIGYSSRELYALGYDPHHYRRAKTGGEYIGEAIIIPHFFEGELVGYQEGWLDPNRPKHIPKYTNSRNFPKAETLFGFDIAMNTESATVFVVESALTVAYLDTLGYRAVATFGASVGSEQYQLLTNFSEGITIAFDNDASGIEATRKMINTLGTTMDIGIIDLDLMPLEKSDLNDYSPEEATAILEAEPMSAAEWVLDDLSGRW